MTATLSITTINDRIYEGSEFFTVSLSAVNNGGLTIGDADALGSIYDRQEPPVVNFPSSALTIPEANNRWC